MVKLIIVNKKDQVLGYREKEDCHSVPGILHRAFSIFIFNQRGQLLIQKRSAKKKLWPLYWTNSCCSHPTKDKNLTNQAKNRLLEELGFTADLRFLYKFNYNSVYKNIGSETELVHVLAGNYDAKIKPNAKEIADINWISTNTLKQELKEHSGDFTPWFILEVKELIKRKILK